MDFERAELYWKWGVRAGVALMLLLANVLLAMVIANASDAFDAMDKVGESAAALKRTAESMDALAADIGEDADRLTSAVERAGDDVAHAREALEQAGADVTRAADDFGRIADTLEEAFAQ